MGREENFSDERDSWSAASGTSHTGDRMEPAAGMCAPTGNPTVTSSSTCRGSTTEPPAMMGRISGPAPSRPLWSCVVHAWVLVTAEASSWAVGSEHGSAPVSWSQAEVQVLRGPAGLCVGRWGGAWRVWGTSGAAGCGDAGRNRGAHGTMSGGQQSWIQGGLLEGLKVPIMILCQGDHPGEGHG